MGTEIERRWLVRNLSGIGADAVRHIEQGYLERSSPLQSLRVRIIDNSSAVITGKTGTGMSRSEIEEPIPLAAARMLMEFCDHRITKTRHVIGPWELDVFSGVLEGVVLLEFESGNEQEVLDAVPPLWAGDPVDVTDSLTNLHLARLASDMTGPGGQTPLNLTAWDAARAVRRVVITGGPGSGKSTIMRGLKDRYPSGQFVPEVATLLMSEVGIRPGADPLSNRRFQQAVWRTQKIFERTSVEFAAMSGKDLVVMDRGTMDNAAYLPNGTTDLEKLFNTTARAEYSNYDLVLNLAVPPREVYEVIKCNNPARGEDFEGAVRLGNLISLAWECHPRYRAIGNHDGWEGKVAAVTRELDQLTAK